jgi:hypothetical protein
MKTKLLLLLVCTIHVHSYTQVFGPEHLINENVTSFFLTADLDSDGDMDLIYPNDDIIWLENDGTGNFILMHTIFVGTYFLDIVYTSDIDLDGDIDVLSTSSSSFGDYISWYENLDGSGNFGPEQIITTDVDAETAIHTADLDGDGDPDVLSVSFQTIAWYENTDGLGNFGSQQIISIVPQFPKGVFGVDIDMDGDNDVLTYSASTVTEDISWYENDGTGNFGPQKIITTEVDGIASVHHIDLDGDNDIDILSASLVDRKIAWYENDGNGNFGPQLLIETETYDPHQVHSGDIDLDGDMDVFAAFEESITWYENTDGLGNFGEQQIITEDGRALFILPSDLNGDSDVDLIASIVYIWTGKLVWYENLTILNTNENSLADISVYPNPSSGIFNVQSDITVTEIEIYNSLGQLVQLISNHQHQGRTANTIDISSVSPGMYFLIIRANDGNIGYSKILKE